MSTDSEEEKQCFVTSSERKALEIPQCSCCRKGAHRLHNCYKFVHRYSLDKKREFAETDGRCFRCLRQGHVRAACSGREVECRFCKNTAHHYMLCDQDYGGIDSDHGVVKTIDLVAAEEAPISGEFSYEALGDTITKKRVTPLQMVLHVLDKEGNQVQLNAMPDTGSTHNIIEMEALKRMGLEGTPCKYTVTGHGGHTTTHEAVCAEVVLCAPDGRNTIRTKFFAYSNP